MHHPSSLIADAISALAILGAIFGYLPYVAALAGLAWYCIQLWESKTVRGWFARRRARKIAKLRANIARLEAQDETSKH